MPVYTFKNKNSRKEFDIKLSFDELQSYKDTHPHLEQVIVFPTLTSGRGMGKPDSEFRDLLKDIKKKHSKGLSQSSINTF